MRGQNKTADGMESQETRFLKAFEDYSDALFRHASIRISDREKAVDIVHDTFTKVWSYVRNGHEIESYRSFLYKVLNNLIIDEYRKKKEMSLDSLLEAEGVDEGSFSELSESTGEALAATLDGRKAFELLGELPDEYSEVIILRFVDGLGPQEISDLLEVSENVVSVRIHRGLKALRVKMEEKAEKSEQNRLNKQT
jgi:RNA polymerase sigma-70 factor, ECF subfamily